MVSRLIAGQIIRHVGRKLIRGGNGITVTQTGGERIKAILDQAERQRRSKISVGIHANQRDAKGQPMAGIAAVNEFAALRLAYQNDRLSGLPLAT